ncbi:MAG TPA: hypothetical protein VFV73_28105 [Streptosporangiaceae bacterium]|nr:hypothetical protein [Streptosporangiaceae bacterium]
MSQGNIAVTMRVRRPLRAQEQDLWDSLIPEFSQEVLYPSRVRLVITDRYEELAGTYAVQSASRLNQAAIAADYRSAKPGGAMAVAKTVDLPDDKVAVIVNAGLTKLGREVMRRTLLHEAQHVCLIQNADSAMAVHKRVAFYLPGDLTWEFVWLAESIIDEFRCERTLHEKGLFDPGIVPGADECSKVVALFDEVRDGCNHGLDITTACHRAFAVLERLGTLLSYAAASMVINPGAGPPWAPLTPAAGLAGHLSYVPGTKSIMRDGQLASISLGLAWLLREVFQDMGFDYRLLPDGSKQFELLRRMD